jgi:hypothetical protein
MVGFGFPQRYRDGAMRFLRAGGRGAGVMSVGVMRRGILLVGCLVWLTACETDSSSNGGLPNLFRLTPDSATTGSIDSAWPTEEQIKPARLMPSDPNDDLSLGKENFREGNYGRGDCYFRKAL